MAEERNVNRVYQVYLYAVCLVTVLVLLSSVTGFLYSILRIAIPGTTAKGGGLGALSFMSALGGSGGGSERDQGIVQLIQSVILTGAAGVLFLVHWTWAEQLMGAKPMFSLPGLGSRSSGEPARPKPKPAAKKPAKRKPGASS